MTKKRLEYISSLFNIPQNEYITQDIINNFIGVDFDSFRDFYNRYSNYAGSEYQKGFDKFLFYIRLYKRFNTDKTSKLDYCESLAQKVKFVSTSVIDDYLTFENIKIKGTDENFFTDKDISTLSKIGTLYQCAKLQRSISGTDSLLDKMRDLVEDYIQLPNKKNETINAKTLQIIKSDHNNDN